MGFFNQSDKQANYASNLTTIAAGSKFTGQLDISCSLHIDGEFFGDINSNGLVTIGKEGSVEGNIRAEKMVLTGRFRGDANCEHIELIAGGDAQGKLIASVLIIDDKSSFQGESQKPDSKVSAQVVGLNTDKEAKANNKGEKAAKSSNAK